MINPFHASMFVDSRVVSFLSKTFVRPAVGFLFIGLLASACSDSPTTPAASPADSSTSSFVPVSTTTSSIPPVDLIAGILEISVTVGVDSSPGRVVKVPLGTSVRITLVNPDAADEYDLHGYNIVSGSVRAGTAAVLEFTATVAGIFGVESHVSEQILLVLEVA